MRDHAALVAAVGSGWIHAEEEPADGASPGRGSQSGDG
jgi:hypothetical protein